MIIFAAVFFLLPLAFSVYLSLTRWNPLSTPRFTGLRNYEFLLTRDHEFWNTMINTFTVAGGLVVVGVPVSLVLAAVFARSRGRTFWRSALFLPQITNVVAIGYMWQFLLNDNTGLINRGLGLAGLRGPDWLTDPTGPWFR